MLVFRELFDMPRNLLAKTTVAAYGSFNFRCLEKAFTRAQVAQFFNESFARVVLFESFHAIGEDNSISATNAPAFYETIDRKAANGDVFMRGVQNSIAIWNNHIAMAQLKSIEKVAKTMRETWEAESAQLASGTLDKDGVAQLWKKRKGNSDRISQGGAKIVSSIIVAKNQQMVLADFGLIACILESGAALFGGEKGGKVVQCTIAFDEGRGNTMPTASTDNKVFLIKDVNKQALVDACQKAIE